MGLQENGTFETFCKLFTQAPRQRNGTFKEYFHTTSKMRMLLEPAPQGMVGAAGKKVVGLCNLVFYQIYLALKTLSFHW